MGGVGLVDIARGEATEKELDSLIRRRHDHRVAEEGERPLLEAWAESERRREDQRRREWARDWRDYHIQRRRSNLTTFRLLDAMHAAQIAKYEAIIELNGHQPNGHKETA